MIMLITAEMTNENNAPKKDASPVIPFTIICNKPKPKLIKDKIAPYRAQVMLNSILLLESWLNVVVDSMVL